MQYNVKKWGILPDGTMCHIIQLSYNDISLYVSDYGATFQSMFVTDSSGTQHDIIQMFALLHRGRQHIRQQGFKFTFLNDRLHFDTFKGEIRPGLMVVPARPPFVAAVDLIAKEQIPVNHTLPDAPIPMFKK